MQAYKASDGKVFQDRKSWKKYEFELSYAYRNKTGEHTFQKDPGTINGCVVARRREREGEEGGGGGLKQWIQPHQHTLSITHTLNCFGNL
jgi:hypothetical protein